MQIQEYEAAKLYQLLGTFTTELTVVNYWQTIRALTNYELGMRKRLIEVILTIRRELSRI